MSLILSLDAAKKGDADTSYFTRLEVGIIVNMHIYYKYAYLLSLIKMNDNQHWATGLIANLEQ